MTKEHVAYWSDEQRRRDAIERFWEGFPYREVPDGGPCLWVSRAGIDGAGLNPLDALRRSCAADIDAWERSALQGERHPHEDLLHWNRCALEGAPVYITGDRAALVALLRVCHEHMGGAALAEFIDVLARGVR